MPALKSSEIAFAGNDYVLIPRTSLKREETSSKVDSDVKESAVSGTVVAISRAPGRSAMIRSGGTIKVTLWQKISQSQTTTALLTASALQPSSALNYASFYDLYDLVRCTKIDFHSRALDGSLPGTSVWFCAFDPSSSGNLGSAIAAREHKYSVGPIGLPGSASGAPTNAVSSPSGHVVWSGVPQKTFQSGASNDIIGSNWYPSTTTSAIVGYMKPYVENGGAGTVYLTTFICYHLEFKCRG